VTESPHLRDRPERNGSGTLLNVLAGMMAGGVCVLGIVFGLYFTQFGPAPLSTDPAIWGQFGDFVGGVVNPLFGLLSLLALLFTIILQSRQLDRAIADAEITRQQFIDDRRPWITASAILASPLTWEEKGLRFYAQVRFRNIGKIPATHFFAEAVAHVQGPSNAGVENTLLAHMSDVKSRREQAYVGGPVLFPGEERIVNFGLLVFHRDIDLNPIPMAVPRPGESVPVTMFAPYFVGNAAYRYAGSDDVHQTGFSYMLVRGSNEGHAMLLCRDDGDVSMEAAGFVDSYEGKAT